MQHVPQKESKSPAFTHYAPAERATPEQVSELADKCLDNAIIRVILQSVDGFVLILNEQRQILAANPEVLRVFEIIDPAFKGFRFGEAMECIHSHDEQGGAGRQSIAPPAAPPSVPC